MKTPKIGEIWRLTYVGRNQEIELNQTLWECLGVDEDKYFFQNVNYEYIEKSFKRKKKFFNSNLYSYYIFKSEIPKWKMEFVRFDINCYNKVVNHHIKNIDSEIRELKKEISRYEKEKKLWQARIKKVEL